MHTRDLVSNNTLHLAEGFGKFQYNFKMYKDGLFAQEHVDYPIDVTLSDTLHFEVNSTSNDGDLVILIDRCFATPTMDYSKDPFKYIFIEDRYIWSYNTSQYLFALVLLYLLHMRL